MNSRSVNDENVIKGTKRNYGSNRNSGNVNKRNNRNDYEGNGNDGINDGTKRNKQKKYVWYGKNNNSESGNRNQSDCKECNVRKRYNSRDNFGVTYDLSELPSGSFCGNNTAPGNLQHNNNDNGNGNKNINKGHGDYGNRNGSGGAERCKIINKVKCPSK